jgi:hypothetical protein
MKAFFLSRAMREKVLLLLFAALALMIWAGRAVSRAQAVWEGAREARTEVATQRLWLANAPAIAAKAAAAKGRLDPARTLSATKLLGELSELAVQAGLKAEINGGQRTEQTDQFAFHTVQLNFRRADLGSLVSFYKELAKRSPYIGIENFSLEADRANPGQVNAGFRLVSAELGGP